MNVAARPLTPGKTRTCPHCKATILESLSICPGCQHHLRFDNEAVRRQVAATSALRIEGLIRHPSVADPLEYFVVVSIRNDRGEEVTRQVVSVGALHNSEKRSFTLSVEMLPPETGAGSNATRAAPAGAGAGGTKGGAGGNKGSAGGNKGSAGGTKGAP